jgi:predicted Ser/Thr protein kinase
MSDHPDPEATLPGRVRPPVVPSPTKLEQTAHDGSTDGPGRAGEQAYLDVTLPPTKSEPDHTWFPPDEVPAPPAPPAKPDPFAGMPAELFRTGAYSTPEQESPAFEYDDISPSRPNDPAAYAAPAQANMLPRISGYDIERELGRGGMGVVYLARQRALDRVVALKVIRSAAEAGSDEVARFRSEAEAIARLQHPNIVQIFEVGDWHPPGGPPAPFCALEYIDGGTLHDLGDGHPVAPRKTAEVMELVARAVHAAHRAGIVHRDLKPANVLLTRDGTPKLTDFGLAKRLDTDQSQTSTGTVMGTPLYMAPEQAAGRVHEISPATDVYSLGAMLYEFLVGRPPICGETMVDTLVMVQQVDPVPVRRLQPNCPRDLETICLKCLEKQPRRRYATAVDLADDLRRWLDGEPVRARPVPAWERAWKWARRRPAAAALMAVGTLATVGFAVGGWAYAENQRRLTAAAVAQRDRADANRKLAEKAVKDLLLNVGSDTIARDPGMERVRKKLLKLGRDYYGHLAAQASDDPDARREAARARRLAGDIHVMLGDPDAAEHDYDAAVTELGELVKLPRGSRAARAELARTLTGRGDARVTTGRPAEAEAAYRAAGAEWEALAADATPTDEERGDGTDTRLGLGAALVALDRLDDAEAVLRSVASGLADDSAPALRQRRAQALNRLGEVLARTGRAADAEAACREAVGQFRSLASDFPAEPDFRRQEAVVRDNLGNLLRDTRPSEAETEYRAALALRTDLAAEFPDVPSYRQDLAGVRNNLALTLQAAGKLATAEDEYRAVLAIKDKLAADFPRSPEFRLEQAGGRANLAMLLQQKGDRKAAGALYRDAADTLAALAADHPAVPAYARERAAVLQNLAVLHLADGKPAEADAVSRDALEALRRLASAAPKVPAYRQELARAWLKRATLLQLRGSAAEADAAYGEAVALLEALSAADPAAPDAAYELAIALQNRARLRHAAGRAADAERDWRRAGELLGKLERRYPDQPRYARERARGLNEMAAALAANPAGRAEAERLFHEAEAVQQDLASRHPDDAEILRELARTRSNLGILLATAGRTPAAEQAFEAAVKMLEPLAAKSEEAGGELAAALANRAGLRGALGEHKTAAADWERVAGWYRPRHEAAPGDAARRGGLAESLVGWADALRKGGRRADAVARYVEAEAAAAGEPAALAAVRRRAWLGLAETRLEQGDAKAAADAARAWAAAMPADAVSLVNAASVLAGAAGLAGKANDGAAIAEGYAASAVGLLRKAMAAGVKDAAAFDGVPALEPLRSRDDYKRLKAAAPK